MMIRVLTLVAVLVGTWCASLQAEEVRKEEETGVAFKVTDEAGRELLGMGVREKFGFDIFAIAIYAKPVDLQLEMHGQADPIHTLIYGAVSRRIILHFVIRAPGNRIQQNFAETLKLRMTKRQFDETCKDDYQRLLEAVEPGANKGDRIYIDFDGEELQVLTTTGAEIYTTRNVDFIRAIFKTFLDSRTNIPSLREGILKRACTES